MQAASVRGPGGEASPIPVWIFFNNMPFGSHGDPTEAQLRWQVFTALAYVLSAHKQRYMHLIPLLILGVACLFCAGLCFP